MSAATYPRDIITEFGWQRIHQGHDLDRSVLRADLVECHGEEPGKEMEVAEVHLHYRPRIKWCEAVDGWGCDSNGEWHGHWFEVAPNPAAEGIKFTLVNWTEADQ